MVSTASNIVAVTVTSAGIVDLLVALTILFVGIMAGLFFGYSVSVVLTLDTLSASAYTTVMRSINDEIQNVVFLIAFTGSAVVPVVGAAVILLRGEWTTQFGQVFVVGVVIYVLGTVGVTAFVHIPMNEYIATWSPASPPDDWEAIRARWARWNHVRTLAAIISFISFLIARGVPVG